MRQPFFASAARISVLASIKVELKLLRTALLSGQFLLVVAWVFIFDLTCAFPTQKRGLLKTLGSHSIHLA